MTKWDRDPSSLIWAAQWCAADTLRVEINQPVTLGSLRIRAHQRTLAQFNGLCYSRRASFIRYSLVIHTKESGSVLWFDIYLSVLIERKKNTLFLFFSRGSSLGVLKCEIITSVWGVETQSVNELRTKGDDWSKAQIMPRDCAVNTLLVLCSKEDIMVEYCFSSSLRAPFYIHSWKWNCYRD